ncbi:MAG: hypothetical protein WCJ51_03050 [Candidatus Moraniibacteriota bacterium]
MPVKKKDHLAVLAIQEKDMQDALTAIVELVDDAITRSEEKYVCCLFSIPDKVKFKCVLPLLNAIKEKYEKEEWEVEYSYFNTDVGGSSGKNIIMQVRMELQ